MLAGVAGGVAERLDADPSIIRVVWALLIVLTGGIALIAYIVMAIVVPDAPAGREPTEAPGAEAFAAGADPFTPAADPFTPAADPFTPADDPFAPAADPDAQTSATPATMPLAASAGAASATAGWIAPSGKAVPLAAGAKPSASRKAKSGADRSDDRGAMIGGLVLILIGGFFLIRQFIPAIDLGSWWPLILVGIGVVLVIMSISPRKSG